MYINRNLYNNIRITYTCGCRYTYATYVHVFTYVYTLI